MNHKFFRTSIYSMCLCLILILTLPLMGCEVTFKTREFSRPKSHAQKTMPKKLRENKSSKPIAKQKLKVGTKQNQEASMGSKVLSLFGLKSLPTPSIKTSTPQAQHRLKNENNLSTLSWIWPVKSTKDNHISLKKTMEGMIFHGKPLTSVLASANGVVTYSGSGLKNYGNLIIIKHDNDMLSVYANNKKLIVKEGDTVKQGQEIAKMGDAGKMHFEIRQNGKSLDPLKVLPNKVK